RTETEHSRLDSADAISNQTSYRLKRSRFGKSPIRHNHCGPGAVQARRVAGGDRAVFAKCRAEFGQSVKSRFGPGRFVAHEMLDSLFAMQLDSHNFAVELAGLLGGVETLLRAFRETVLVLARQLRIGDEIFGVPARMLAGKGVFESVAQQGVLDLRRTHAITP